MRAIVFDQHGGPEVVQLRELPDPEPAHGEVRIRVVGCGVNHLDLWIRNGMPGVAPLPHILGSEVSGRVDKIGPGVTGLTVGQSVVVAPGHGCGRCEFCAAGREEICADFSVLGNQRQGGYAEFIVVPAADCLPVSDRLPLAHWAAVPLVFQTAWHMLFDRAGLRPGMDVLVESAGSGVGTAALQIIQLAGARSIATAGGEPKRARVSDLGADIAIDYQAEDVRKRVKEITNGRGVDIVFAHVGGENFARTMGCLARGGRLVTCGATAGPVVQLDLRFVFTRELTITGAYLGTRADLLDVVKLVDSGKLHPVVAEMYPLDRLPEAHRRVAERDLVGKLVVTP